MTAPAALRATVAALLACACEAPSQLASPAHAVLVQTCAPWDGPAIALFLTDQPASATSPPPPYSAITIYQSVSAALGRRFAVGAETPNLGSAQACPANGECRPARSASIGFGRLEADSTVQVEYRLDLAPDGTLSGKARARLQSAPALCG